MKYIRTECGVYEFTDEMCVNKFGHIAYKDRPFICVYGVGNKVIAQADTIPELCDEFVIQLKDGNYLIYDEFEWALDKASRLMEDVETIYGAIWTYKGLIYVAKMNDDEKLELI